MTNDTKSKPISFFCREMLIYGVILFFVMFLFSLTIKPQQDFNDIKKNYHTTDSTYKIKYDSLNKEFNKLNTKYDSIKTIQTKVETEYETLKVTRKVYLNAPIQNTTNHLDSFRLFVSEFSKGK